MFRKTCEGRACTSFGVHALTPNFERTEVELIWKGV